MTKQNQLSNKLGLPPGSLIHVGHQKEDKVHLTVMDYGDDHFDEATLNNADECLVYKANGRNSWINVDGLHDTQVIESLGANFDIHPLLLEDILNTRHRPKYVEYDGVIFVTLKMIGLKSAHEVVEEQVSLVLGQGWLISFQEKKGDVFNELRRRLREGVGQIRQRPLDYLFYRLIDTIVDNYYFVMESLSDKSEALEERVLESAEKEHIHEIRDLKKTLSTFKKNVIPLREAIIAIQKDPPSLISKGTSRYFTDVLEHIIQISEHIEIQREIMAGIMDLHLSSISNKMNQVMQVLTIIATIFIPLTFIAGIYGMNFTHMPELQWEYGYLMVWVIMIIIILVMLLFFRRKKWL